MTHQEVIAMLEEIQIDGETIPYAYSHFAENEAPDPPFICFLYEGSDNFSADNVVYHKRLILNIELYTDAKDPDLEEVVEDVLDEYEIFWEKEEAWIADEKLYEICYVMTI